jgi:hypothetical protein
MKIGDTVKSMFYGDEIHTVKDVIPNPNPSNGCGKFAYCLLENQQGVHYRHELTLIEEPDKTLKEVFNTIRQKWRIIDSNTMLFVTFDEFKKELKDVL